MSNLNIILEIDFDINRPDETIIRTNAKKEALRGIFEAWLSCQRGKNKDESEPSEGPKYKIKILLDLSDDTFYQKSDTGNKEVTSGIVWEVLRRLDEIEVLNLS